MKKKITHDEMVATLCKDSAEIIKTLSPLKMHLIHMSMKLCSEAGELADAVGKCVFYNQPLDIENCKEEMGDMEFYESGFRQALGFTEAMIKVHNMNKLAKRYKGYKYSDKAAKQRKDKQ